MSKVQQNKGTGEFFKCAHAKQVTKSGIKNCYTCGIMIPQNENQQAYKSGKLKFGTAFNPQSIIRSMKKNRQPKIEMNTSSDYFRSRNQLVEYMWDISEKLRLSLNSTHLAIYFMDLVMNKVTVPSSQFQIYAATAVMLGAKSIELDERIPFISKLKKYSGLYNRTQEFTRVEGIFVKTLNWNLQCVTLIDVVEFYLSQGIIFSNDSVLQENNNINKSMPSIAEENNPLQEKSLNMINNSQNVNNNQKNVMGKENKENSNGSNLKSPINQLENQMENMKISKLMSDLSEAQIFQLVTKAEKEYTRLANLIIKDSSYYQYEINSLACACIGYLRKQVGLENKWNENLEQISKIKEGDISELMEKIEKQFQDSLVLKGKRGSGFGLKHSKTSDLYEIENNYLRKQNSYSHSNNQNTNAFGNRNSLHSHNNSNIQNQNDQFDLASKYTNHTNSNNLSTHNNTNNNKYSFQNNDFISFNNFNNQQQRQRNSLYSGSNSIISGGISTLNNSNNINSQYRQHQSYLSNNNNYQQQNTATQFQHRVSGSTYVQKVYRVNSGIM